MCIVQGHSSHPPPIMHIWVNILIRTLFEWGLYYDIWFPIGIVFEWGHYSKRGSIDDLTIYHRNIFSLGGDSVKFSCGPFSLAYQITIRIYPKKIIFARYIRKNLGILLQKSFHYKDSYSKNIAYFIFETCIQIKCNWQIKANWNFHQEI